MSLPSPRHIAFTVLLVAIGGVAGFLMSLLHFPLPYMLGSLLATAIFVAVGQQHFPEGYKYPEYFRMAFIAVIGVMIGGRVSPEVVAELPKLVISIPAVLLFVVLSHVVTFQILRRVGKLDRTTAFFSGSPGGLIESITFGEEAGADLRMLTIMQFLRIIVVVTIVPLGMSIYEGHPVGSSAGVTMGGGRVGAMDILTIALLGLVGLVLGRKSRLPAGQMTGPLFLTGILGGFGLIAFATPGWLLAAAQVVLGVGLGVRFTGITRRMLAKGLGLSLLSVVAMLGIGIALAVAVSQLTGLAPDMMVISFAPGGVTEMSLIALSLAVNPALVAIHHLVRIVFTVVELSFVRRMGWLSKGEAE